MKIGKVIQNRGVKQIDSGNPINTKETMCKTQTILNKEQIKMRSLNTQ